MPRHLILILFVLLVSACSNNNNQETASLNGFVKSGDATLGSVSITLYSAGMGAASQVLATAQANSSGVFGLSYTVPSDKVAAFTGPALPSRSIRTGMCGSATSAFRVQCVP